MPEDLQIWMLELYTRTYLHSPCGSDGLVSFCCLDTIKAHARSLQCKFWR